MKHRDCHFAFLIPLSLAVACTGIAPRGPKAGPDAGADAGADTDGGDAGADDSDAGADGGDAGADADAGSDAGDAGVPSYSLSIWSASPSTGPSDGGTSVTIYGSGFVAGASVTFGGTPGAVSIFSGGNIAVTTPAHALGTVDIVVTIPDASATLSNGFTFCNSLTVTSVNPTFGPAAGDASVDVTFTGYGPDASVFFGDKSATITVRSNGANFTTLTVRTPPGRILETVPVKVATTCGTAETANAYANLPRITTYAGGGTGANLPATTVAIRQPEHAVVDDAGTVYVSDAKRHRIYRIRPDGGILKHFAGSGESWSGPDGPAVLAAIHEPAGLALASDETPYFAETSGGRVRRFGAGSVETVAGTGSKSDPDAAALDIKLNAPIGLAFDSQGRLLITDRDAHVVRRLDLTTNRIHLVAGTGDAGFSPDASIATQANLNSPIGIVEYPPGTSGFAFAENGNHVVRWVDGDGGTSILVGGGTEELDAGLIPARAVQLYGPYSVARDSTGTLFISEVGAKHRVFGYSPTFDTVFPLIGTGSSGPPSPDGTVLGSVNLGAPRVATSPKGPIYVLEANNQWIRVVDAGSDGTLALFRIGGTGLNGPNYFGDDAGATSAGFSSPSGLAVTGTADMLTLSIADALNNRIRQVSATGIITTYTGNGDAGFSDGSGDLLDAQFNQPRGLAYNSTTLLVSDTLNNRVREITWVFDAGPVKTKAGNGDAGYSGEGGLATSASFGSPSGLAVRLGTPEIYFASWTHHVVLKVDWAGNMVRVAGIPGQPTPSSDGGVYGIDAGDGALATNATLNTPTGIAFDNGGKTLFIADLSNHRIRRINLMMGGVIETIAGNGIAGSSTATLVAIDAGIDSPLGICVDSADRIFFTESTTGRVRMIAKNDAGIEMISIVVAAPLGRGFYGDNGYAGDAGFLNPGAIACGSDDALYISDAEMDRVRRIR
ncbi:MAG: IPT/TIG domain-containing protein [Deltaproteobacteria bacterium]|nr:IPT/TIG domain-containing protein [Deltaproteobacteria bacterium]